MVSNLKKIVWFKKMKIIYFGAYDPNYPRNKTLIKGLRQNGVEVIEINDRSRSFFKYLKLFFKYFKNKKNYDAVIVGFPGQESMFLAKMLTRKPIIFDTFTSHYGGHVLDRGHFGKNSLRAKWYKWLDKKSVSLSNVALLDTDSHIDFFVNQFNLPREKFRRVWVGTDSHVFYPREVNKNTEKFLVHFQGNYIPLQGTEYIIKAAKLLEEENVVFTMLGRGQTYKKSRELADKLGVKNINFIGRVLYEKLADYINMSNVSLGIFGHTLKTELVIPNKVFEAIACAMPVITADTSAVRELFTDQENILFCQPANPKDLADKILKLKNDPSLRQKIAGGGYKVFQEKCAEKILGEQLLKIIKEKV